MITTTPSSANIEPDAKPQAILLPEALNRRAYFAAAAMQGLLATTDGNANTASPAPIDYQAITEEAVMAADFLIVALNAEQPAPVADVNDPIDREFRRTLSQQNADMTDCLINLLYYAEVNTPSFESEMGDPGGSSTAERYFQCIRQAKELIKRAGGAL